MNRGDPVDWLKKHKKNIVYGLIIVSFAFIWIYRIGIGDKIHNENEYFVAEKQFQSFIDFDKSKKAALVNTHTF